MIIIYSSQSQVRYNFHGVPQQSLYAARLGKDASDGYVLLWLQFEVLTGYNVGY